MHMLIKRGSLTLIFVKKKHKQNKQKPKNQKYTKKNTLIFKVKQFMLTKISRKKLCILEDGAIGVQVGDIQQVIV